MERTKLWTLLSAVVLAGCAVSTERDDLGAVEQGLTPKVKPAWIQQFGTVNFDRVFAVATFGGYVYTAGRTTGELAPLQQVGDDDGFVRKYDANGTIIWTRQFQTSETDDALAVAADATGVYVGGFAGQQPQQAFVRKFDPDGNPLWFNFVGPPDPDPDYYAIVNGLAVDATGLYVVGEISGTFPGKTSSGGSDAFVTKYEHIVGNGPIWTQQFGSSADDRAFGVFVDGTGVYVAGQTNGDLGGGFLGVQDAFVAKFGLNGNTITDLPPVQFGTELSDSAYAITGDSSGIYVGGISVREIPNVSDPIDGFLRKFDRNLKQLWERPIAAGTQTNVRGLAVDDSGVLVTGFTNGAFTGFANKGFTDFFVRKLDRRGRDVFAYQDGTAAPDQSNAIATAGNTIYIGGNTNGVLGAASLGDTDAFLLKLVPNVATPTKRK